MWPSRASGLEEGRPRSSYGGSLSSRRRGWFGCHGPRGPLSSLRALPSPPRPRLSGPGVRAPGGPWPDPRRTAQPPASRPSLTAAPSAFLFRTPRPPGGRAAPPGTRSLSAAVARCQGVRLPAQNYNSQQRLREPTLARCLPSQGSREAVGGARGAIWEVQSRAPRSRPPVHGLHSPGFLARGPPLGC